MENSKQKPFSCFVLEIENRCCLLKGIVVPYNDDIVITGLGVLASNGLGRYFSFRLYFCDIYLRNQH